MIGFFKKLFSSQVNTALADAMSAGAFLVDVRTAEEFAAGSAKGAVNIPLNELEERLAELKDKERIVVFCASGMRSSRARAVLMQNGITTVVNGGSWQRVNQLTGQ